MIDFFMKSSRSFSGLSYLIEQYQQSFAIINRWSMITPWRNPERAPSIQPIPRGDTVHLRRHSEKQE
jgi:hypothetical protein